MFHEHNGKLLECYRCSSAKLIRHGSTSGYAQRFLCQDCHRTFSVGGRKKYNSFEKNTVVCRANEQGLRKIAKAFHISPNTIRLRRTALVKEDTTKKFVDYNIPTQSQFVPY